MMTSSMLALSMPVAVKVDQIEGGASTPPFQALSEATSRYFGIRLKAPP